VVDGEDYLFTVAIHVFDDASTFHPGIPAKSNRIPQVPSAIGSTKTRSDTTLIAPWRIRSLTKLVYSQPFELLIAFVILSHCHTNQNFSKRR
jgi:hypothetical protein